MSSGLALLALTLLACDGKEPGEVFDADGDGVLEGDDCDDNDGAVYPGAPEVCDDVDQDCDGNVDEAALDAPTWYADEDEDAFGDPGAPFDACDQPLGFVADDRDCDDQDAAANPSSLEYCDQIDNDCDTFVDEDAADALEWYLDADGDGYGIDATEPACDLPPGFADNADDCDDANSATNPGAQEVCGDGIDNDCSGSGDGCELLGEEDLGDAATILYGETSFTNVGTAFARGDIDGDGVDDLFLGTRSLITGEGGVGHEVYSGSAYLVYGPVTDTRRLDQKVDPTILPEEEATWFGQSIAVAGDVNGDGYQDLLLGDPEWVNDAGGETGAMWLFYGDGSRWTGARTVAGADVRWRGSDVGERLGTDVAAAGDVNGDGLADFMVTGPGRDISGRADAGVVLLLFGAESYEGDALNRGDASVRGAETDDAPAGDVDGDGYPDLLIGTASAARPAYLIHGPLTGTVELREEGVSFVRDDEDIAETAVAGGGDIDGDGRSEILIGSPLAQGVAAGDFTGAAYLFYSSYGPLSGTVDLEKERHAWLTGETEGHRAGNAVALVGDVNGDGRGDLLVGADSYGESSTSVRGAAYLFYSMPEGQVPLADAEAILKGQIGDGAGSSLGALGDPDGDGYYDLLVGAPYSSAEEQEAGALYLLRGGRM
jgi:hypothetical protein